MIIKITLNPSNKFTLINQGDLSRVRKFKWYLFKMDKLEYAIASVRVLNGKILKPLTYSEIAKRRKRTGSRLNNELIFPKGTRKIIFMHRFIMNPPKGMEIDHINGNGLDNRRSNLRICTRRENGSHRKLSKLNTSGYHGVHLSNDGKRRKRWTSMIRINGKKKYLGRFFTKEEAAQIYNNAAIKYHGKFASLNEIYLPKVDDPPNLHTL